MQLEVGGKALAFRVAATRFADIRKAIAEKLYATMDARERRGSC